MTVEQVSVWCERKSGRHVNMNAVVEDMLSNVALGSPQTYRGITVLPLHIQDDLSLKYLTLGEALSQDLLYIAT